MNNFKFFNENVLVSSDGLVSRLKGKGKGVSAGTHHGDGHLTKEINGRKWYIHDLVWTVFRGEIPKGFVVHHINHQRDDNRLENLQLMPNSEHTSLHHSRKIVSEETRQKLSNILKGRTLTEEHIKNAAIGHYKPVRQMPLDGSTEIVWDSATTAAKTLNIDNSSIVKCCKGNMKTYKKSKWEYV